MRGFSPLLAPATAPANHATGHPEGATDPVSEQQNRPGKPGHHGHQLGVFVLDVSHFVGHDGLHFFSGQDGQEPLGDREMGLQRACSGDKGVGVRIGNDVQFGLRNPGGNRHLFHHILELRRKVTDSLRASICLRGG